MKILDMKAVEPEAIARVHVQAWREAYTGIIPQAYLDALSVEARTALWTRVGAMEDHEGRVAVVGSEVVGFVSVCPPRESLEGFDYELAAIYLLKNFHKKGIGHALVRDVFSVLPSRAVFAWVLEKNPSRAFYENLGCTAFARKVDEIGGESFVELAYSFQSCRI